MSDNFTEEDAMDDAKIKNEIAGDLQRSAKERSPRLYEHFQRVCEELNQTPGHVLADMLIRAIDDDAYADDILDVEVTMEAIQTGDFRKEDIRLVKELSDELGLEQEEESDSVVDRIIERRIESVSTSPLDSLNNGKGEDVESERVIRELNNHIKNLEQKVDRLENQAMNNQTQEIEAEVTETTKTQDVNTQESEEKKDIDELFGEESKTEDSEVVEEEEQEEEELYPDLEEGQGETTIDDRPVDEDEPEIDIERSASEQDDEDGSGDVDVQ